jgi:hypothetical protein
LLSLIRSSWIIHLRGVSHIVLLLKKKIFGNTDNWDLDKGNEPKLQYDYKCVEVFSILE